MTIFPLVSSLLAIAAVSSYINYRYIKLPSTIGVMLVGLLASTALIVAGPYASGLREQSAALIAQVDFDEVLLHGMLAFLLFAGSIHVDLDDLGREWLPISLLAVVGTLFSTFVVGVSTWWVLGLIGLDIPLVHALLFGALISPTDPIAVLGLMKSAGAPRQLEVQVSGESLFNDGLGVVVFLVLLQFSGLDGSPSAEVPSVLGILWLVLTEVGGAVLLGLGLGIATYRMLKQVDNYQVEVLLTLALAMGSYALADALHLSAPIAVVVAGLFVGNQGRAFAMTEKTRIHVDTFWELIDEILNVVLFLLIGLELLILPMERGWIIAGLLVIPIVLGARLLSVGGIIGGLRRVTSQSPGAIRILTWAGLRGGISVALALSIPASESRSLILTLTYVVVVFSILVQGMTVARLIRRIGHPPAGPAV